MSDGDGNGNGRYDGFRSWNNNLPTISLALVVVGGILGVTQIQINSVLAQLAQLRQDNDSSDSRIRADQSRDQTQLRADIEENRRAINQQFADIQNELERRRTMFVGSQEFNQFQGRVLADDVTLSQRLLSIEQTRPTTGELQATAASLREVVTLQQTRANDLSAKIDNLASHQARDPASQRDIDNMRQQLSLIEQRQQDKVGSTEMKAATDSLTARIEQLYRILVPAASVGVPMK